MPKNVTTTRSTEETTENVTAERLMMAENVTLERSMDKVKGMSSMVDTEEKVTEERSMADENMTTKRSTATAAKILFKHLLLDIVFLIPDHLLLL
jgi:hypothetical protein